MRTAKSSRSKGKVLFVNGENLFKRGRNQNTMDPEHVATLVKSYREFADGPGLARVATLDDIEANGYNLNISLYVEPADNGEQVTVAHALADLEATHAAAVESRAALETKLAKWGLGA